MKYKGISVNQPPFKIQVDKQTSGILTSVIWLNGRLSWREMQANLDNFNTEN